MTSPSDDAEQADSHAGHGTDFRLLFENMDSAFALHEVIQDGTGKVVDYRYLLANPAFTALTGLKDVAGRTVKEVLPHVEQSWIRLFGNVALDGTPVYFEDYVAQLGRWYGGRAFCPQKGRFAVIFNDITQRKLTEEKLRRFEFILANTSEEFYIAQPDGQLIYTNRAAADSLGYTVEEMLRMGVPGFDPLHDQVRFREHFEELKRGDLPPFETIHVARDGHIVPKEMHSVYIKLGDEEVVCGFGHDITGRRAEQERLRGNEEKYRILFQQNADAVFVHEAGADGLGRFVEVNGIACARLGYTRDELLCMSPKDIDGGTSPSELAPVIARIRNGEPCVFEQVHVAKDGRRIPVEIHSQSVTLNGRPAVVSVVRDISERRRLEEERLAMERQVQQAQKLESLGVLAGGIAHDFNNILMAILGNVDLAQMDTPPDSPVKACMTDIENAARRAAGLCKQMLAYSGKGRFVITHLNLNTVIADMVRMLEVAISKKVTIRTNLADDPPMVEADATQMQQVIMNLVINAAEACGSGDGMVSITTGSMDCDAEYLGSAWIKDCHKPGRYAYIEVADTGCGIAPDKLPRIFDPFYTTKSAGRGLGLAAVLGIVRGHRGALKVYSEQGKGTTFRMLFPAAAATLPEAKAPDSGETRIYGGEKALVVDDDENSRDVASRMLKRLGFEVVTASDGKQGLDLFAANGEFAFVLLDLTMPRMDGAETYRELRRVRPDVRVIMTSGYNEQDVTQRFAGKRLAGFIQKPYQLKDLETVVRQVLSRHTG